jgi:superfamily I DNA and RNA helicase
LIEWLTAEAILNRPANPIQFCRDLLGEKLADSPDSEFKPELITDWLRNCYTEATALVDENGVIQGKSLETAQQSLSEQVIDLRRKVDGMQTLLDASSTIATLDPHQATENIIFETCRILDCDRATIFTLDKITSELVLSVAEGAKNIRIPVGQVSGYFVSFLYFSRACTVLASAACLSLLLLAFFSIIHLD